MIRRCKKHSDYRDRGITVCKEWLDSFAAFESWALTNGYADELTLDREKNDEGYYPSNCRWVTYSRQNRNKRTTVLYQAFGERKCMKDWAEDSRCQVAYEVLRQRIHTGGWVPEVAITMPRMPNNVRTGRRRSQRFVAALGEQRTTLAWSKDQTCQVAYYTLVYRIRQGWGSHPCDHHPGVSPNCRTLVVIVSGNRGRASERKSGVACSCSGKSTTTGAVSAMKVPLLPLIHMCKERIALLGAYKADGGSLCSIRGAASPAYWGLV